MSDSDWLKLNLRTDFSDLRSKANFMQRPYGHVTLVQCQELNSGKRSCERFRAKGI